MDDFRRQVCSEAGAVCPSGSVCILFADGAGRTKQSIGHFLLLCAKSSPGGIISGSGSDSSGSGGGGGKGVGGGDNGEQSNGHSNGSDGSGRATDAGSSEVHTASNEVPGLVKAAQEADAAAAEAVAALAAAKVAVEDAKKAETAAENKAKEDGVVLSLSAITVQGPLLAWFLLDPTGACARAEAKGYHAIRKLAEFRSAAIRMGIVPLAVGTSSSLRPQKNVIAEASSILRSLGEYVPTEKELIDAGWFDALVGSLYITGSACASEPAWAELGRWTQDIGRWPTANLIDPALSRAFEAPVMGSSWWMAKPCGKFTKIQKKVISDLGLPATNEAAVVEAATRKMNSAAETAAAKAAAAEAAAEKAAAAKAAAAKAAAEKAAAEQAAAEKAAGRGEKAAAEATAAEAVAVKEAAEAVEAVGEGGVEGIGGDGGDDGGCQGGMGGALSAHGFQAKAISWSIDAAAPGDSPTVLLPVTIMSARPSLDRPHSRF